MPTFIQFLEDLTDTERTITIPADELDRLAERFGDRVRLMGRWMASGDGSLEVPIAAILEAANQLGRQALVQAVHELKAEQFAELLEGPSSVCLIEKISEAYRRQFRALMTRYQNASDSTEVTQLRDQMVREVFGE